jgi:hypothetical protein
VSVVVVGEREAVDEVNELRDALIAIRAAAARQVVVPRRDAGIDDGDSDPCPETLDSARGQRAVVTAVR